MSQCTSRPCSASTCRSTTRDHPSYLMGFLPFLWAIYYGQATCFPHTRTRPIRRRNDTELALRSGLRAVNFVHTVAAATAPRSAQQLRTKAPAQHVQKHRVIQKYLPTSATQDACMPVNASGVAPEQQTSCISYFRCRNM